LNHDDTTKNTKKIFFLPHFFVFFHIKLKTRTEFHHGATGDTEYFELKERQILPYFKLDGEVVFSVSSVTRWLFFFHFEFHLLACISGSLFYDCG